MEELKRALEGGADVIGVNSRDLKTFHVSLDTLIEMAESIPNHVLRIAESGIDKGSDIRELHTAGYQAFLIGETLMRAEDPANNSSSYFMMPAGIPLQLLPHPIGVAQSSKRREVFLPVTQSFR